MYEKLLPVTSVKCSFCIQLTGIRFQLICTSHLLYFYTKVTVNVGTAIPHFWSILSRIRKLSKILVYNLYVIFFGTHGGALGWNTTVHGRGFDYRWYHWKFSLTYPCSRIMAPGVDSASNEMCTRNISREVKANFPPSCTECLEIWERRPTRTLRACNIPVQ